MFQRNCWIFQFTPLREGRRKKRIRGARANPISIHAPPRGATHRGGFNPDALYFNSRPSARGDNFPLDIGEVGGEISIHAPPRGATICASRLFWNRQISIHAPPRGATGAFCGIGTQSRFQFTPLREGRRTVKNTRLERNIYFNSRPSARGDISVALRSSTSLFQFTPLREGRRERVAQSNQQSIISIHAPPRGATEEEEKSMLMEINFNSRPSARGDEAKQIATLTTERISIHAPPRGATFQVFCIPTEEIFQFTPLREGRQRQN